MVKLILKFSRNLQKKVSLIIFWKKNCKFESAGTTRHKYGRLYEEDGKLFFKLNLQIRFLK
ncbi:MAG: HpaII family restriction endonuclease [Patescibacteria group bacterium]